MRSSRESVQGRSVASSAVRAVIELGLDDVSQQRAVLSAVGLDAARLEAGGRIEAATALAVWEEVGRASGDPAFGLRVGSGAVARFSPVMQYLCRASETVRDAFVAGNKYHRIVQDIAQIAMINGPDGALEVHHLMAPRGAPTPEAAIDCAFSCVIATVRLGTGRADLGACRVELTREKPSVAVGRYVAALGVAPEFCSTRNVLTLPKALLDTRNREPDALLASLMRSMADAELAALPKVDDAMTSVRDAIRRCIPTREPTLASVAKVLRISARTLQRRLAGQGVSFQELCEGVRREMAEALLRDPSLSLAEVARKLGYSDPSTFHRAFVRWTAQTPGHFRAALLTRTGA